MSRKRLSVRSLVMAALFTALTAVCAQISVPNPFVPLVPFTLQVFAVLLCGALLGARLGFLSQVAYLLLGALGAPVYAGLSGGAGHLFAATGGFLWSFPIAAAVVGALGASNATGLASVLRLSSGALLGVAIIYAFGLVGMVYFAGVQPLQALVGLTTFIPWDLLKGAIVVAVASKLQPAIRVVMA